MIDHANHMVVPFRLYNLLCEAHTVVPAAELADNKVLVIDGEGHVHELTYHGRLIDQPPLGLSDDDDVG